ncbi:MAG: hypothetical protein GAK35_03346 [Herbaspirillum frisingense]|uniref:Uncharacterized protein n=1 Tax=Herbaspirillum frisingense TaxID=92645 RepID=A0A7V8FUE7_9BURK|nr:MAG: hypothetical protein GAK35_03346 [Herbaspirillum frisingense]
MKKARIKRAFFMQHIDTAALRTYFFTRVLMCASNSR